MSSLDAYYSDTVASAPVSARVAFIRRTYAHLAVAVLAFVGVSAALIGTGLAEQIMYDMFAGSRLGWFAVVLLFSIGTFAAQMMGQSRSVGTQYAGLSLYVLLYALLFVPILTIASDPKYGVGSPDLPLQAGVVTLMVFGGLTTAVFVSGKDFSFMGPILTICSFLALGVAIAAMIGGFSLGLVFCSLMVALFAGYIIYDTSNIMHHYGTNQHVAASMALFGSFAMLFYYILMLFLNSNNSND